MKKVLFAVALVMGLGSSVAFANNMASDVEIVAMVNEFKPIDIKELPQARHCSYCLAVRYIPDQIR